jgi:hypothetical protein
MTGNNNQRREKYILTLIKGDEKYIFIYDQAGEQDTIRKLGKFAMDTSLSFSWFDAATLRQRMKWMKDQDSFKCEGR